MLRMLWSAYMAKLRSLLAVFEAPMQVYKAEKQLLKRVWKDTVTIIQEQMLMCGKVTHKNLIDSSLYSVKKVLTHIRNRIYNIYEIGY